jgi:hypothetical protein
MSLLQSVHPVVCHKHIWLRLAVITTNDYNQSVFYILKFISCYMPWWRLTLIIYDHQYECHTYINILWLVDPLLGNNHKISNYTTATAKQWLCKQRPLLGNGWVAITWASQQTWMEQWIQQQRNSVLCAVRDKMLYRRQLEQWASCGTVTSQWEHDHWSRGHCWNLSPGNDWWSHSRLRRLSTCCSRLHCMWITDSATVTCNHNL